jgi:uncharacterized delta-60 repeat protein
MKGKWLGRTTLPLIAAGALLIACNSSTTVTPGVPTAFAVMRFNAANGALDTTFAGTGKGIALTDVDPTLFDFAVAVAIQPADSKILAAGSSGLSGQGSIAMVRYNQDGSLDSMGFGTAGTGGIVRTPTPPGWTSAGAAAVTVQPADNKILLAAVTVVSNGASPTGFSTGIMLIRYKTDGTLDTTFSSPIGFVIKSIGFGLPGDTCALAMQGTNIIVAGGSADGNIVLYRYDTTGALDPSFGTNGQTITPIGNQAMSPALGFQSNGSIIVATGTDVDQAVLRYSANGMLDTTFGPPGANGIVITDIGGTTNFANAIAVQSDDKLVVAGHSSVNFNINTSDISLVRYNSDGTLDPSFIGAGPPTNPNPPGIVTTDLGGTFDNAFSIALTTPGAVPTTIVVSGNTGNGGLSQAAVLRYTSTGTLDPTFGANAPNANGVVIIPIVGPSNIASASAVTFQTNLGIVVAGYD